MNSDYAKNYLEDSVAQYNLWIAHWTNNSDVSSDIGIPLNYEIQSFKFLSIKSRRFKNSQIV